MIPEDFLSPEEEKQVVLAIKKAEKNTSGEIRVHLEKGIDANGLNRTFEIFQELGMQNTAKRNAVLFHINVDKKIFTVIGDEGINNVVPPDFWKSVNEKVISKFKKGKFAEGLIEGIDEVGTKLKKYFPYQKDDINELPDEISKNYS